MNRIYWMSFCDGKRPKGEQFLGVCIIEVTDEDAAAAKILIDQKFPHHALGAEWMAAATRKAIHLGCNPGGEVAFLDITEDPPEPDIPRGRLMGKDELRRLGMIE